MTISEIAKLAGVSTSTVSRVFSHHPNIREDVRNHVFAVARQMILNHDGPAVLLLNVAALAGIFAIKKFLQTREDAE